MDLRRNRFRQFRRRAPVERIDSRGAGKGAAPGSAPVAANREERTAPQIAFDHGEAVQPLGREGYGRLRGVCVAAGSLCAE